jgi:hypothetical protein
MGSAPYHDMDVDTAKALCCRNTGDAWLERASSPDTFADADRNPPVYDPATYSVTMPEGFKKSYDALMDSEWLAPGDPRAPRRHQAARRQLRWAAS